MLSARGEMSLGFALWPPATPVLALQLGLGRRVVPQIVDLQSVTAITAGSQAGLPCPASCPRVRAASLGAPRRAGYSLPQPGSFVTAQRLQASRRLAVPTHKAPAILPLLPALMQLGLRWVHSKTCAR